MVLANYYMEILMRNLNMIFIVIIVTMTLIGTVYNCKKKTIYYSNQELINIIITGNGFYVRLIMIYVCIVFMINIMRLICIGILKECKFDTIGLAIFFLSSLLLGTLINLLYISIWLKISD